MENITAAEKNKMALTYGLVTGIVYIALCTACNLTVSNLIAYYCAKLIAYVLYFVIIGIFAARIRKANGGYIEFREVFGAIFIMALIAGLLSYLYNYLYITVIDKTFMDKIRAATISFMEKMKTPDDKIDDAVRRFDKQVADAKVFNIGKFAITYFGGLVLDCLFGLIVGLIVKKNKPVFDTM